MRLWPALLVFLHCGPPCAARDGSRCEALACPSNSHTTSSGHCACSEGLVSFAGACVPAADREATCGPAAIPAEGGCAPKTCPTNVIDGATGVCLPVGSIRALAEPIQVALLKDETLACSSDADVLVAGGNSIACVPKVNACGPGAGFRDKSCAPVRACPPGEVPIGPACERVVRAGDPPLVDVAMWTRAMIGADGGEGSSFLCGDFQRAPWVFTTSTDVRQELVIAVDIRIPDNDLTQARARVDASMGGDTGQPVPVEGLEHVVDRLVSGLRALGGTARASAVSTRVRCNLAVGGRPIAMPFAPARSP